MADFVFTCEKCGGQFYSKVDPSGWRHHVCNGCSGKPYPDRPVGGASHTPQYRPQPVPTAKPVYNSVAPAQVKKEFNLDEYIAELLLTYNALKIACDEQGFTIPIDNLCSWTTSIMIQKEKAGR